MCKKVFRMNFVGRVCLLLSTAFTYFYLRDVPRALDYMITGELPPRLNVFWLEYSIRDFYVAGKFSRKIIRSALPAAALGFSGLLFVLGCVASSRGGGGVRRSEAFVWAVWGALLVGINVMTTWVIWKAFVFL